MKIQEPNLNTPVLRQGFNRDTLLQRQSELDDFVLQTRVRLQALSQSLTHCQIARQSIRQETREPAKEADIPPLNPQQDETPAANLRDRETRPGDHHAGALRDFGLTEDDVDPMERLNAIKLRLAQQIENS